nr:hypothetical protein [Tanacetum cinerariifolium]
QLNVPSSVADVAITMEMHNGLGRATITASSLEAEQGSGNISKTKTKATPSRPSSLRTSSEGGPGCYVTMRDSPVQDRPERLSNLPNEPPLGEGNTSRNGEGSMPLLEFIDIYTKLSGKVTALENELKSTKAVNNKGLITLTKRVKKLEKKLKHKRQRAVVDSSKDEEATQIQADEDLAQRMLEEEIKSLSIEERSRLLTEFIDKRKKMLAAKRAEEKRNKPPTQAQQRTYMSNYIKNMGGYTLKQLKQYSFKEIKMLFDQTIERIRNFIPMESEYQIVYSKAGEESSKEGESLKRPAEEELGQEQQKKQQVEEEII